MRKHAPKFVPVALTRPPHALAPSSPSPSLLWLLRLLYPFLLRYALKCTSIGIVHADALVGAWKDFQEKSTRLIIAFRHPYGDEPQLLGWIFGSLVPREARRLGITLKNRPHARFVHGYEVALWGGAFIRAFLPRIGAVPVYHVKFDSKSISAIRTIIRDDDCPLALAPEGQVSYRSETVPRLEEGTAQLAFWCAGELEKSRRNERVSILPLSIHYQFDVRDTKKLLRLVGRLETSCGLETETSPGRPLAQRLSAIDLAVLAMTETFYGETYGFKAPEAAPGENDFRQIRWNALIERALSLAEHALGLRHKGGADPDTINRVYRIRQECWDRLYPDGETGKGKIGGGEDGGGSCTLTAALADRRAGEAWYAMRHMELVDLVFYLDSAYIGGLNPSFDRLVETAYNLDDLASRLSGGAFPDRANVMRKKAVVIAGPALDITARLADYRADRKAALKTATGDLNLIFTDCIKGYLDDKKS